jgi:DNA polymerase III delta prime subunit
MINLPRLLAPTNWSEYYGQNKYKHAILISLTEDGMFFPNSLYLAGDTGTGKTSFVNLIIRSLLCENPGDYELEGRLYQKINPCGECAMCKGVPDFRRAESSFTNITLVQYGKGDEKTVNRSVDEALRLAMTPPASINPHRKDYRFIIFDEWQMFDKNQKQKVLLQAEDGLKSTIFIFITMAEEELGEKRLVALVSRGLGITLDGFTEKEIEDYLLTEVNDKITQLNTGLTRRLPKLRQPEAQAIAKQSHNSLRMALQEYGMLFRYDLGLEYVNPATAKMYIKYTDSQERLELWSALNSNWTMLDECVERFTRIYTPSRLNKLGLDLIEDISNAIRAGHGDREDQLLAINTLLRFVSNYKTYRLSDFLVILNGLNLGIL